MQFKKAQRTELSRTWHESSWFFRVLGEPARAIVSKAYGLIACTPKERSKAQEDMALIMSTFARRIGCEKSHAVHALLSGSIDHLIAALERIEGNVFTMDTIREAWEQSFRGANSGTGGL